MGIGSGIALMVVGAILYFAVDVSFGVVNVQMIGLILMIAGLAVAVISVLQMGSRRSSRTITQEQVDGTTVTREDRRDPGAY